MGQRILLAFLGNDFAIIPHGTYNAVAGSGCSIIRFFILVPADIVALSLVVMTRIELPFEVSFKTVRIWKAETRSILVTGIPLALQDLLTNLSFIVINAVANKLGPDAALWPAIAAGYSVDNKITTFMMILPSAFLQSMSVFVAQNTGAGKPGRIRKGFGYMVPTTLGTGLLLAVLCFFRGRGLARIFATDAATIYYAAGYLKGFAGDMLIGCLVLMMLGCFNGGGHSTFVMLQGLFSAFAVRIPVVLLLCAAYFLILERRKRAEGLPKG